jgi:hypothetical protein
MTATPEEIARKLTPKQAEALVKICEIGNDPYGRGWVRFTSSLAIANALKDKGLLISARVYGMPTTFRFTELGKSVAAVLTATSTAKSGAAS